MNKNNPPTHSLLQHRVSASFSKAAHSYDRVAVLQREVGHRMCSRLSYIKHTPKIILDLGAGTGYFSRILEKQYRKSSVYVLDFAPNMLKQAKKQAAWFSHQVFICADAHHIPLPDHCVDFIFSNFALHWCNDLNRVFAEIRRVLQPNGLFMFTTLGPDTLKELRHSWAHVDDHTHVNAFMDMHDVGDALIHQKFADPVLDMEYFTLAYPDVFTLMQELKLLGAHNLNSGRKQSLTGKKQLQTMINAYESFRNEHTQLPATYEVIYGHAWAPALTHTISPEQSGVVQIPVSKIKVREGSRNSDA